jgi:hypothetical protein
MLIRERFLKVAAVQKTDDSKSFGRHVNKGFSASIRVAEDATAVVYEIATAFRAAQWLLRRLVGSRCCDRRSLDGYSGIGCVSRSNASAQNSTRSISERSRSMASRNRSFAGSTDMISSGPLAFMLSRRNVKCLTLRKFRELAGSRISVPGLGVAPDLTGTHREQVGISRDVGKGCRIGSGHENLRAKPVESGKQCRAPAGIEMRHHLVEQQHRR